MKKIFLVLLSFLTLININTYAYGYGFKKNNEHIQPDLGIYAEEMKDTNSFYAGNPNDKVLYLTFDSGYDNGNLSLILDTLKEKSVKGTFFVTGDFVNRNQDLLKRIVNEGHIIGNHTYNHKNITKLSPEDISTEISKLEDKYYELTGLKMTKFFRPPEGEFNKASLKTVQNLGYRTFFWSIAYNDWNTKSQKGEEYSYNMVMDNLHNGAIILMHTVSNDNAKALSRIIDDARNQGYIFKNLDEIN